MKQISHKIMSMVMAFVVLCSTLSFTVNMHYCGDTLIETAVFQKAKGCGMDMKTPLANDCEITKKNCCDDKQLVVDGQDELQLSIDKISFQQQAFITSFVYTYLNLLEHVDNKASTYKQYKPPHVVKPIFKLDETYLI
ncbi:MAG: hypothetical protein GYB39_09530 [Algicola sp.]|nr:hypothetical protein [Algicola sp.]